MQPLLTYFFPWRHVGLIRQFAQREMHARYRQSILGTAWAVLTPLLMLAVYTFVFRFVLRLRWGSSVESDLLFALRLYAGLAVFNFFAECVSRAPRLILEQPHLVKKVVFPLEILPWVNAVSSLAHLGIALVLLVCFGIWEHGAVHATLLALPLVWLALLPLSVGLGWLLSALGTYVRDVAQVLGMLLSLMMFLSPIFFPVEALPKAVQPWMALNPLALTITQTRLVIIDGSWPDWSALAWHFAACCAVAVVGALFFRQVRKGFADVV
ncbi:MAG: ABC transporter permease [Rhodoferax sp.]|nr:ABC transporter permease [Rhodoferax sp.]